MEKFALLALLLTVPAFAETSAEASIMHRLPLAVRHQVQRVIDTTNVQFLYNPSEGAKSGVGIVFDDTGMSVRGPAAANGPPFSTGALMTITPDGALSSSLSMYSPTIATNNLQARELVSTTSISASVASVGAATSKMRRGGADRTWVGQSDRGYMTYLDTQSAAASYSNSGGLGVVGASRTSDRISSTSAIGGAFMGRSDSSTAGSASWGSYSKAVRDGTGYATAIGAEISSANRGDPVMASPYQVGLPGTTAGLWLSVGTETAESGLPVNPSSCALCIVHTTDSAGAKWSKGIIIQSGALMADADGVAIALQLPKSAEIDWNFDGSQQRSGFIRSDGSGSGMGIVFSNGGLTLVNNAEAIAFSVDPVGNQHTIGTAQFESQVTVNGPLVARGIVTTPTHTPVRAIETCVAGQQAWDTNFIYLCVSSNTWKRSPLSSW